MNSPGYMSISTVAVLASPRPVDPQKGPRNVVFDANLYIAEDTEQSSLALLRFFVPDDMINAIQKITETNFQKAFIVANVRSSKSFPTDSNLLN
jgi:hypothetical protein